MNPISSNHWHKSKQTTSTRITAIHDWINHHIKDGRCQKIPTGKTTSKPKEENMDEMEVYMDDMFPYTAGERGPFEDDEFPNFAGD